MCEERVTYLTVTTLLGCSDFVNYFGHLEDYASDNIQEIIFLGSGLMWNDATVCGGIMELKISVKD